MCPFEVDMDRILRSPLNILSNTGEPSVQSVTELKKRLQHSLNDVRSLLQHAQARQAAYSGKYQASPSYTVGKNVFLSRQLIIYLTTVHPNSPHPSPAPLVESLQAALHTDNIDTPYSTNPSVASPN